MDRSDSGASPHCAPLAAMPLMNATGYRMGFLLLLVANSIFTLEEFVITISFLRLGYSQIACARTLGICQDYCIQVLRDVSQRAHLWEIFTDALERRWEFHQHSHPIHRHVSAIVDSTHVAIQSPSHRVDRELFWFDKPTYRGHALVLNAMINWGREIIACWWWYPPCATDAEMTADMDASIPWNFNGTEYTREFHNAWALPQPQKRNRKAPAALGVIDLLEA